jgi:hypothetical protein
MSIKRGTHRFDNAQSKGKEHDRVRTAAVHCIPHFDAQRQNTQERERERYRREGPLQRRGPTEKVTHL